MKIRDIFLLAIILVAFSACNSCKTKSISSDEKATSTPEESIEDRTGCIDFTTNDLNGQTFSAQKEFALHKITIIDFWASWCGPCRAEMPLLVSTYNAYKDKGLGIIGVSLDEDKDQWTDAIHYMGMTWPQVSDLKGWNNSVALQFGVRSIPFTIIVDSKGKPLQVGLRGQDLVYFIQNFLN